MSGANDFHLHLQWAKTRLPEQGPLEYFIHHNTLHHYQDLDFLTAVKKAAQDYHCQALMDETFYWHEYEHRVINKTDLLFEINRHLQTHHLQIPAHIVYRLLIQPKTDNHRCADHEVFALQQAHTEESLHFYRDLLMTEQGVDIDYWMQPIILKLTSAYFDQGVANWALPGRRKGLWQAFSDLFGHQTPFQSKIKRRLADLIAKLRPLDEDARYQFIMKNLQLPKEYQPAYLFHLGHRYKGWSAMIKSLENKPEWRKQKIRVSFAEFMQVLLACELAAIQTLKCPMPRAPEIERKPIHSAQFINHFLNELKKHPELALAFHQALPCLGDHSRQAIWHQAYERSFYQLFLSAYQTAPRPSAEQTSPSYQIITCLDEREESLRRYLERDSQCQTFSTAGHFGLNMVFKGYFDKQVRAMCPALAKPQYEVIETGQINNPTWLKSVYVWGELLWLSSISSKTLVRGTFDTLASFIFRVFPMTLDIIAPKLLQGIKQQFTRKLNQTVETKIQYQQEQHARAISLADRIQVAQNLLSGIGLTEQFAPLVIILGHGSSSLNNPHEAAYDCGACGGGRGGPNARIMAAILNEAPVRQALHSLGISIPESTRFVGAYHNTCSDEIYYYDTGSLDPKPFQAIQAKIRQACQLNAKERSRRFSSIPIGQSPAYCQAKVLQRSIDLRQPRPEYGHSSNAICIIGPRPYSRSIFLDRRSFLLSYDHHLDPEGQILHRLLNTAVPVCAGINLEYLFSYINNEEYGCGTKLPHNVTGLVGVMNGYLSDLQTGLSLQMIEIHQPVRLLTLIIAPLSAVQAQLQGQNEFVELVTRQWIRLAVHDPLTDRLYLYDEGQFNPFQSPVFPPTYFREDEDIFNARQHLPFGHIAS